MNYTGPQRAERIHVPADRGSVRPPDAYHPAVEGNNSTLALNVCMIMMIFFIIIFFYFFYFIFFLKKNFQKLI